MGVTEILEALGLKDYGTSGHRTRAVFHYEPLLKLYKLEIPSLFGRLLRDEGILLDRADPNLFQVELGELLAEFGPLIWPTPGQGSRDHLLKPQKDSRYRSDIVYPRDESALIVHLRKWILSKHARIDIDVDALIEKRHKDANMKIFSKADPSRLDTRKRKTRAPNAKRKASATVENGPRVSLTDSSSEDLSPASDAPLVNHRTRRRTRFKRASRPFRVAVRLYRTNSLEHPKESEPTYSYGTLFLDDDDSTAAECFAHIDQHTGTACTYIEFHPPEDMSLEGRIRIDPYAEEADEVYKRVMTMFREACKFPGEPSYRTVEAEIGVSTARER